MRLETKKEWFAYARANEAALVSLLECYHPTAKESQCDDMKITAAGAEAACEMVREAIRNKELLQPSAIARFHTAIAEEDYNSAYELLTNAWFGVPESTSCWHIPGFKEAVELLENPLRPEEL